MTKRTTIGLVAALLLAGGAVGCDGAASPGAAAATAASPRQGVPRLVDLGADKCVPCKAMAPILEGLRAEYAGLLEVVFIDVWKDPEQARANGVRMIPTQIFYGPDGRELARHEGFLDRAQILARWKALGVEL